MSMGEETHRCDWRKRSISMEERDRYPWKKGIDAIGGRDRYPWKKGIDRRGPLAGSKSHEVSMVISKCHEKDAGRCAAWKEERTVTRRHANARQVEFNRLFEIQRCDLPRWKHRQLGAGVEGITTTKAPNNRRGRWCTPACARTCSTEKNFKAMHACRTGEYTFQLVAKALDRFYETGPKTARCRTNIEATPLA